MVISMDNDFEFNFIFDDEGESLEELLSAYISNMLNSNINKYI